MVRHCLTWCLVAVLCAAFATAQTQQVADYELRVGGEVERELKLGPADFAKLPRRSVQAKGESAVLLFAGDVISGSGEFGEAVQSSSFSLPFCA